MSDLEIVDLDAAAFDAWHQVFLDAELATGEGIASPSQLEGVRATMQDQGTRARQLGWFGYAPVARLGEFQKIVRA